MKILMLVNWKIEYCNQKPNDKQPPDYYIKNEPYWFFRFFEDQPEVDVVDVSSFQWLEKFEKSKLHFYVWQTIKIIPQIKNYDLIISHGMQSGVVLSLYRRIFKTKTKHVVFDIGSFNSAAESGFALKLMQFASKSIDGLIYHTSSQLDYYKKFFPWIVKKANFIRFGTDVDFFYDAHKKGKDENINYIVCVGYAARDWDTLVEAYRGLNTNVKLKLIGNVNDKFNSVPGVEQLHSIPVSELNEQINNALFCILPLESVNFSYGQMTLMQQMALGKCVIAARVPSLVDYIEDTKTAILYTPKDVNDLRQKMNLALTNSELREEIGRNAYKNLTEKCNERIMAGEIEQILKRL